MVNILLVFIVITRDNSELFVIQPVILFGIFTVVGTPVILHILFAIPALLLGTVVLSRTKGTPSHKFLGRSWVLFMAATAISSFWIRGLNDGFSPIHVLSVVTLAALAAAVIAIRKGQVRRHRFNMIGAYCGIVLAAAGTLAPGRLNHQSIFGG